MSSFVRFTRFGLLALALALPGAAFAQDEEAPAEGGDATEPAEGTDGVATVGGSDASLEAGAGVYTKATWPTEETKRPITLTKGMLQINGNIGVSMSKELVGKPIVVTPNVFYGVSDKLTIGLVNSSLCVTGKDNGCAKAFNSLGLDVIFAFMTGKLNVGAHGGVAIPQLSDPMLAGVKVGVLGKYMAGKIAVTFDPSLYIGITERDFNKEGLDVPVHVAFQATPKLAPFLHTGISAPLDGFGDFYQVPVGVGALFGMSNKLDIGGQFTFANLAGKGSSADFRAVNIFCNFRM